MVFRKVDAYKMIGGSYFLSCLLLKSLESQIRDGISSNTQSPPRERVLPNFCGKIAMYHNCSG